MDVPFKNFKAQIVASGNQASWAEKLSTLVNDRPWEAAAHIFILLVCAIVLWRTPLSDQAQEVEEPKVAASPVTAEKETKGKETKGKFYADEGKLNAPTFYTSTSCSLITADR